MQTFVQNHSSPAVVFKRRAAWDGIRLEHFRFRAGEMPEHIHKEHLVLVPLSENCNGEIRTASGFRVRAQAKGAACVIPSGQALSARLEGEAEHLAIYLEPSLVFRAASESGASSAVEVVERCSLSDPIINHVGMALLAEMDSEGLSGRLYAESLANVLAVHLLRHYTVAESRAQKFTGGLSGHRLRAVMDFIAENYEQDLSLTELAHVAGMSTFHFAREFKRATGTTPHQYLIKFRVERAKALLVESEIPLVEVGFRSGFSHQSHFSRLFRRLTGTTPLSYRLMFQS
ncbi:MAG: helix-turn-helix transcriptional regulator [Pyrinomonadaceae bacterium]|nr:helix-turn-helix transcriptional regulator [Pyrinomonadaceae bacterium]